MISFGTLNMSPLTLLLFFLFRLIHLPIPNHAQLIDCTSSAEYCWNCSSNGGNYSANSLYQRNLNNLLLSFPSVALAPKTIRFYNLSSPQVLNKVNVIALCRGDVDSTNCLSCLNTTSRMILDQCPNQMEAILWGERCMVRYSNRSIYQVLEEDPSGMLPSPNPVPDPEVFKNVLKPLLDKLINETSSNERLYGTGNAKVADAKPIYALAQCTPDLTEKECKACLQDSSSRLPGCCAGVDGARILKPSCHLRFENGPFYSTTAPQQNGVCTDNAEYCWKCLASENDTSINMFMTNVKELLSSFSSDKTRSAYGFFNSSIGENSNKAYAIALCRGDLSPESCRSCVSSSSKNILDNCPNRWEAILWDELCMVRYNNSIFSARNDDPRMYIPNPNNVWESNLFRLTLKPLLDKITSKASMGDSLKKYDSGQATVPGYETIYAAAQCTPDLDKDECYGCLDDAANFIPQQFDGKQGGRILKPSCNLRFEVKPFFSATADPVLSPNLSEGKNTTARNVAIAVVIPSVAVVIIIIMICTFLKLKKKPSENLKTEAEVEEDISWDDSLQFNLDTMMKATCDFSDENKLGEGGFGSVYKGRLSNGQYIAVKRLSKTSGQGDEEFKNEVKLVAKLQHRNLVRLLGFCLDGKERLLVYEYVSNSSLDRFIFDPTKRAELDWDIRYKIIQGIVRGLLYLHEDSRLRIIHRDLKASNILLDEEMTPKIADFGMARLFVFDQTQDKTNRIVGTYGYMSPEYTLHGQFSVKSDVYSFGVLLLEIVKGEKNSSFQNGEDMEDLLTYAWRNWNEGTAANLIDPKILLGSRSEILRCIQIGLLCVQEDVADRPTVNSIVLMLNSHSVTIRAPSKPAFFMHSNFGPEMSLSSNNSNSAASQSHGHGSKSDSNQASKNEASMTELTPR
ncbi:cysteine-rich receptor-like protein kinase 26 isoform X2 [Cannabis sativa]|uniref:cysteine-rich receptor-like protein kinase 26 isoform X2 n=1 Tax=Cannabis sativa TaxID=3483 RepID=UPI0029CA5F2E|nr:cysteine-rich receptor-like protein kinase 26 isoform X2 [Cannabis sativa]